MADRSSTAAARGNRQINQMLKQKKRKNGQQGGRSQAKRARQGLREIDANAGVVAGGKKAVKGPGVTTRSRSRTSGAAGGATRSAAGAGAGAGAGTRRLTRRSSTVAPAPAAPVAVAEDAEGDVVMGRSDEAVDDDDVVLVIEESSAGRGSGAGAGAGAGAPAKANVVEEADADESSADDAEDEDEEEEVVVDAADVIDLTASPARARPAVVAPEVKHEEPEVEEEPYTGPDAHMLHLIKPNEPEAPFPEGVSDIYVKHRVSYRYCEDYIEDVYRNLRATEAKHPVKSCYMKEVQTDITPEMRGIMVDWLVEVAQEYHLGPLTLHLCVKYIDLSLRLIPMSRSKLQLLGCACMLIAAKMQEVLTPSVEEFIYISDNTYTREEILQMETIVLQKLDFKLTVATPWHFMKRFLLCGPAESVEILVAHYVVELSLQEYHMQRFPASMIAASAVLLARITLKGTDRAPKSRVPWSPNHYYFSKYTPADLLECVGCLHKIHHGAVTSELQAVREKYSHSPYHRVSRRPALPLDADIASMIYQDQHQWQ